MALWSKKPPAPPSDPLPASTIPSAATHAAAALEPSQTGSFAETPDEPAPPGDAAPAGEAAGLSPEELNRRRMMSKHIAATFGEIVGMLMKQPGTKHQTLADLEWMVLPPLLANQVSVAEAQSKAQGFTSPVAVVLWARVSPEIDQRLTTQLDRPIRLAPTEWSSGDIVWLIEANGEARALQALLQRLGKSRWQGRDVKFRSRDKEGRTIVSTITSAPPVAAG